jgi:hypothetical protein
MAKLHPHLTAEAIQERIAGDPAVLDQLRDHDSLVRLATDVGGLDEDEASYLYDIPPSLRQGIGARRFTSCTHPRMTSASRSGTTSLG